MQTAPTTTQPLTITLRNSTGLLDYFIVTPNDTHDLSRALVHKLTSEWSVLAEGDTITIAGGK